MVDLVRLGQPSKLENVCGKHLERNGVMYEQSIGVDTEYKSNLFFLKQNKFQNTD